ncbi:11856_t:CDS:2, partial [Entrophospora sp. SA101]
DDERLRILNDFGTGDALKTRVSSLKNILILSRYDYSMVLLRPLAVEAGSGISEAFTYIDSLVQMNVFKVEPSWVVDATENLDALKRDIHKLALKSTGKEKITWEEIDVRLQMVQVVELGYDHPLCSGILDESLFPIVDLSDESR